MTDDELKAMFTDKGPWFRFTLPCRCGNGKPMYIASPAPDRYIATLRALDLFPLKSHTCDCVHTEITAVTLVEGPWPSP